MSDTVTLELPDEIAQSARVLAMQTHRRLEDVLLEWLDRAASELPVEALPDERVLALRDLQMSDEQQAELSDLLARHREHPLEGPDRMQLEELLGVYRRGLVQKARALKVAVDRGLQPPLG